MASLKPFKGNTQGPVEEFLRQVYKWGLGVAEDLVSLAADVASAAAAASAAQSTANSHASRHIHGGADVIDGDRLDVDYVPTNYTRNPGSNGTVDNDELTSHLEGIDDALASMTGARTTTYSGKLLSVGAGGTANHYWHPYGQTGNTPVTALVQAQVLWGRAGTIKNLRFTNMDPLASGGSFSLTLNINGSDTALTITGLSTNSTGQRDVTNSVSVSAEDKVCFHQANDGGGLNTGSDPSWSFDFVEG